MSLTLKDHIESNPDVLCGKPRIKGTRIPVSLILGYLAAGYTPEQIIAEFPDLRHEQISACLNSKDWPVESNVFERKSQII